METFWSVLVVAGAGALIWFNLKMHDPQARVRAREARLAAQAQIVCKFCQQRGTVSVSAVSRKKGISGGKATGALLTGGASMLLTGLSRREAARSLSCSNCGMVWDEV